MGVPVKRDPEATRQTLSKYLSRELGAQTTIENLVVPEASGFSNETIVFDAHWEAHGQPTHKSMVLRSSPSDGYAVFRNYSMSDQVACMRGVAAHSQVPVPTILFHELDPAVLGSEFYVMGKVEGQVPGDNPAYTVESWLKDSTPQQQRLLLTGHLKNIANLHLIDDPEQRFGFLTVRGLDGMLEELRITGQWALQGREVPIISQAFAWLEARHPERVGPNVLVWGDARVGNTIFDDFEPVAVLDWEMACLGPPEFDVAWTLMMDIYHTKGSGVEPLAGWMSPNEQVGLYESLTGTQLRDLDYYIVLSQLRFALVMVRISDSLIATGVIPEEFAFFSNNPATAMLQDSLG